MQLKLRKTGHKLLKCCLGISGIGRGGPNCPLEPFFDEKNFLKSKIKDTLASHMTPVPEIEISIK